MKISATIRKFRIFLLLGVLFLLINFAWHPFGDWVTHPFEPRYEGKRLSKWVNELQLYGEEDGKPSRAATALRHIGVPAVRLALKLCRAKDSKLKEKALAWCEEWNSRHEGFAIHLLRRANEAHAKSWQIFAALGEAGKPAIPALIKLLGEDDRGVAETAGCGLLYIGTNSIPPLTEALTNRNAAVRKIAALTLGSFEFQGKSAENALLRQLNDENQDARYSAARALAGIGADAQTAVPALITALRNQPDESSSPIIFALGRFGTNARPAIPLLIERLESHELDIRPFSVLNALRRIDPEIAQPYLLKWQTDLSNRFSANPAP